MAIGAVTGRRIYADLLFGPQLWLGTKGGKIEMPIPDGPFGSYFGLFADKYGFQWMVDFTKNKTTKTN